VQTVLLEETPFVGIVEEEGECPVGYDGGDGDEVFVFNEGEGVGGGGLERRLSRLGEAENQ